MSARQGCGTGRSLGSSLCSSAGAPSACDVPSKAVAAVLTHVRCALWLPRFAAFLTSPYCTALGSSPPLGLLPFGGELSPLQRWRFSPATPSAGRNLLTQPIAIHVRSWRGRGCTNACVCSRPAWQAAPCGVCAWPCTACWLTGRRRGIVCVQNVGRLAGSCAAGLGLISSAAAGCPTSAEFSFTPEGGSWVLESGPPPPMGALAIGYYIRSQASGWVQCWQTLENAIKCNGQCL